MHPSASARSRPFFGWRVVAAAFVLAFFGWGFGFYGPPVFLHAIHAARGWPIWLISSGITLHYLVGALTVAGLPALYRRFGIPRVTQAAALSLALGVAGWAHALEPWQFFIATAFSGAGWVAMSAAGVNAIIYPWFDRGRVAALGMAYNGASIGGLVFSPLWVLMIGTWGFSATAIGAGIVMVLLVWGLAVVYFSRTPEGLGQAPDGDAPGHPQVSVTAPWARPLPGRQLRANARLITLGAGMALSLFAQIGLVSHLFSLLVPALGASTAGIVMGAATGLAILGRMFVGWLMPFGADRRLAAAVNYAVQIVGSLSLYLAAGESVPLLLLGTCLFGAGIGNVTSLPPLIAQVEFVKQDVGRAVALIVAASQAFYAFAPAAFGILRDFLSAISSRPGEAPLVFLAAAAIQALAIAAILAGRRWHGPA